MILSLKKNISEPGWEYLYNPHVLAVFVEYMKDPTSRFLWGITGDLDNLGVFVAENGRAKAENLVDLYNQVTRNYISNWYRENASDIQAVCFLPCGEEVLILGTTKDMNVVTKLFSDIKVAIKEKINEYDFIEVGGTGASFGCSVLREDSSDTLISQLIKDYKKTSSDEIIYPQYLKIIERIRTILAIELDKSKFNDVLEGQYPIQMRQLVLSRMLLYKLSTKEIVASMNKFDPKCLKLILNSLGESYGMNYEKSAFIDNLLKENESNKK